MIRRDQASYIEYEKGKSVIVPRLFEEKRGI
jgi:hypothetical protein